MSVSVGGITIEMAANIARLQSDMAEAKKSVGGAMGEINRVAGIAKTALGALGAAVSVGAFVNLIKGSIDAAGALNDLSIKTGASVESLSKFGEVGRLSGVSAEQIGQSMNRLAKSLAVASEDSKGAAAAIKSLGLDFDQFKRLSPDEQMLAVAKAMNGFADGSGKSAAAMALFGKQGAELLPFMTDLAETGELQARVTTEQAAQADAFGDNLEKLKVSGMAWSQELAMGMVPALSDASQAFLDVVNGSGGLRDELRRLSADGTIANWTRMAVTGMTYVMDAVTGVWRTFRVLGEYIGGSVAAWGAAFGAIGGAAKKAFSGDFGGALDEVQSGVRQWNQITSEMGENISKIWSEQTMGQQIRARMKDVQAAGAAAQAAKPQLDLSAPLDKTTKAAKAQEDEIAKLTDVIEIEISIRKALKKEHEDALGAVTKETEAIRDQIAKQRESNDAMRYSSDQLATLEIQRLADAAATAEQKAQLAELNPLEQDIAEQYRQQAAGLRELAALKGEGVHLKAAQEAAAEWQKTSDSIFNSLSDALMRAFESGKGFGKALIDTLRNAFKTLILQPTIQAVMAPIAGGMGSLFAGSAMAGGLTGGGGLMGGLGSIGSLLGGGIGALGSGLGYGLAAYGGSATIAGTLGGAMSMMGAGSLTSALAGVGAMAGVALPVVAGALILKKLLGRGKKKTTEQGLVGDVMAGDFEGQLYADWKQSGGLFHKRRTGTNYSAVPDDMAQALDAGGMAIYSGVSQYAAALKLPAAALETVSYHLKVKLGKDDAENQKAIEAAMAGYEDALAGTFEAALKPFQQAGESISETLRRMSELQVFSETLNGFGGVFSRVASLSVRAREELIGMAGGIEALLAKTQSFVENYYSESERFGLAARQVKDQLAALGITQDVNSRADLRSLIEGTDISTSAGRQQLNDLLTIAQAFAPIGQYLEQNGGTLSALADAAPQTAILQSVLDDTEIQTEYAQRSADALDRLNDATLSMADRIATALAAMHGDLAAALAAIAASTAQTARQLDRWDDGGAIVTTPGP